MVSNHVSNMLPKWRFTFSEAGIWRIDEI